MKKFIATALLCLFPLFAMADMSCLGIKNYNDPTGQKEEQTKSGYEEKQNPAADLMGCFASVKDGLGAGVVKGECGCKQAVKKLCSFNVKKKRVSASGGADVAWCAVFAPWAL